METFTFKYTDNLHVDVYVYNSPPNFKSIDVCIDYHNVADTHDIATMLGKIGKPDAPFAIVSLMYSHGSNFEGLQKWAANTGCPVVIVIASPQRHQKRNVILRGIKRAAIAKLGMTNVCCALDDKPSLWEPYDSSKHVIGTAVSVFFLEWDPTVDQTKEKKESFFDVSVTLVVRKDLNMSPGKIAAQASHATLGACHKSWTFKLTKRFTDDFHGRRIVTVRCMSEAELMELKTNAEKIGLNTFVQVDAGFTQVPSNSPTVLAIGPDNSEKIHEITKHLKLL